MSSSSILLLSIIGVAAIALKCDSSNDDCSAAGGHCVLGDAICAIHGSQTCGSGAPNPGGGYCCLADTAECGQPSAITYACPALDGGAASEVSIRLSRLCQGSPTVFPGVPNYEALDEAGSNDAYPLYCTATLPVCSNGQPVSCTCSGGGEAGAWACVY